MDTKDKSNMQARSLNAELHRALEGAIALLDAHESFGMDESAWESEFIAELPAEVTG